MKQYKIENPKLIRSCADCPAWDSDNNICEIPHKEKLFRCPISDFYIDINYEYIYKFRGNSFYLFD